MSPTLPSSGDPPKDSRPVDAEQMLVHAWLDDALSEEQTSQLQAWLKADEANMRRLVEAAIHDQQLREAVRAEFTTESVESAINEIHPPATRIESPRRQATLPSVARRVSGAIALVLSIALLIWSYRTPTVPVPQAARGVAATVIAHDDVADETNDDEWHPGSHLHLHHLKLDSGSLTLYLESNVQLELLAPIELDFLNPMQVRLHHGAFNATVGPGGIGFTVLTSAGEIVDLGTKFGVEAEDDECRVAVFTGKVELRPNPSDHKELQPTITLKQGHAVRLSPKKGLLRWEKVALAAQAAGLSQQRYHGTIADVHDNLGDKELQPFYGVIHAGMNDGATVYSDNTRPRWRAMPGQPFPSFLKGADVIRTYNRFRRLKSFRLSLTLRQPATLYVLADADQSPPAWLKNRYKDTGARLRAGPWFSAKMKSDPSNTNEAIYVTYAVWKREATAGTTLLGPPHDRVSDTPMVMYGVVIKPLEESVP